MHLSHADHGSSPPRVEIPRDYNAAHDLLRRNAARSQKLAFIVSDLGPRFVVTQKRLLPVVLEIMKAGSSIERVFVIDPPAAE